MELAAHTYDAKAWRLRRPWRDMNFLDVESLVAWRLRRPEFLAPPPRLLTDDDRARHRQEQRRLAIVERNECQWHEEHPGDVQDEEAFYAGVDIASLQPGQSPRLADVRCLVFFYFL
jgi:hypothetical protein